jgi:hypothetical protein
MPDPARARGRTGPRRRPASGAALAGFGSTAAGMLLWNLAVSRMPASRVSLLLYLEPLVSVAGAVALLGEHVSPAMIIGGVLVLAGVGATWAPRRDRRPAALAAVDPAADELPAFLSSARSAFQRTVRRRRAGPSGVADYARIPLLPVVPACAGSLPRIFGISRGAKAVQELSRPEPAHSGHGDGPGG